MGRHRTGQFDIQDARLKVKVDVQAIAPGESRYWVGGYGAVSWLPVYLGEAELVVLKRIRNAVPLDAFAHVVPLSCYTPSWFPEEELVTAGYQPRPDGFFIFDDTRHGYLPAIRGAGLDATHFAILVPPGLGAALCPADVHHRFVPSTAPGGVDWCDVILLLAY